MKRPLGRLRPWRIRRSRRTTGCSGPRRQVGARPLIRVFYGRHYPMRVTREAVVGASTAALLLSVGCGRVSTSRYVHDARNILIIEESEGMWPIGRDGRRLVLEEDGTSRASVEIPAESELPRFDVYSDGSALLLVHPRAAYRADLSEGSLAPISGRSRTAVYLGCFRRPKESPIILFQAAECCAEQIAGGQP